MKKYNFIAFVFAMFFCCIFNSCTKHEMAKNFGGKITITLPRGEKLVECTWKDDNIWYLTEPMEKNYQPKNKTFREKSQFGALEGKVIFIETR